MKTAKTFLAIAMALIAYVSPTLAEPKGYPRTPRGTGSRPYCPLTASGITLTPLIPESGWGYTTSQTPTVWVHINYEKNPQNSISGELSLLDKNGDFVIQERTTIAIPNISGSFPIQLPSLPEAKYRYHWVLEIDCGDNTYTDVEGYIYLQENPELTNLSLAEKMTHYQEENLWYDALNEAANVYCQDSHYWQELLTKENLDSIVKEPLTCPR